MENKYCCNKKMEEVIYSFGEGERIIYYQCETNEEHKKFNSRTDKRIFKKSTITLKEICDSADPFGGMGC